MIELIRELRRREVFRTLGLYVGICWIAVEAASILVPAFEGPSWVVRAIVIVAVAGFPIVGVLAWVYDISERGIARDEHHDHAPAPAFGGRKMDFVVIGILSAALVFSVYLNLSVAPGTLAEPEPVSVLIADFDNRTGDEVFDGVLEQALHIGIEGAPNIASYARNTAATLAARLQQEFDGLTVPSARLLAVREGIDLVLTGALTPRGSGFEITLSAVDPVTGASRFETSTQAEGRESVLAAIGALAVDTRSELGDETLTDSATATSETFTADSIEAARAYVRATELAFEGREPEAIALFRQATDLDPDFGRAWSGWAASEFKLGNGEAAEALWQKALSLMSTMTERERLRTIGLYYIGITGNYEQAVETFTELTQKYPADSAGRNNLAVASFLLLDFETAAAQGARALEMFPGSELYRANYALYAMYASDFEAARTTAEALIEDSPDYGTAYLPLAVARLVGGNAEGARAAYREMAMASRSPHRSSTAAIGLADLAIYMNEIDTAIAALQEGIARDLDQDATTAAAVKQLALAEALLRRGDNVAAIAAARNALEISDHASARVAAALVFFEAGASEAAADIADTLAADLNSHNRAYAMMIDGIALREAGETIEAIETLRLGTETADLWRIRYALGRAYLEGGFFAEAFDEFRRCLDRRGEATAMFLDDTPTVRYLNDLPYWLARAQDALGMHADARENYRSFLERRPTGPLGEDARQRAASLGESQAGTLPQ